MTTDPSAEARGAHTAGQRHHDRSEVHDGSHDDVRTDAHVDRTETYADTYAEGRTGEPVTHDPHREAVADGQRRGANIVLNDALFAGDPARAERYAGVIADIARRADGQDEDAVERIVRDGLGRTDIEVSDVELSRIVEQIVRARGITHVSADHGDVLEGHGDPELQQGRARAEDDRRI